MGGTQLKENGTINWLEQVHQMKDRDIRTIEQHELQELPQDAVEHGLPREERLKNLLDKVGNPYCYLDNGIIVKLNFAPRPQENYSRGIFTVMKKENKAMKEKIYDARTGLEYVLVDDYYLPALKVPRTRPVGRWGMLHKAYLKLRKPAYYQSLLLNGKLDAVLADVEEQAAERYEVLIEQMSQQEGVSEKLKEENQMEWVCRMSNLENRAAEIVKAELIYPFEGR